jgi:serine/threonine protein kinase
LLKWWREFAAAWRDYPLEEGSLINERYRVLSIIGTGSYGLTYRCHDELTQRTVAAKQAKPSKKNISRLLLARERDILRHMEHPFIPACRDYLEYKHSAWLITDYVEGDTLENLIFDRGIVYDEKDVLKWTIKLMDRVGHVHQKGYVHLDLRIPNVIIRQGELYLIDFGLARKIGEYEGSAGKLSSGSNRLPQRMPPELSSDLFDIGHLMLFMLYSGFLPEAGEEERSWQEELNLSAPVRVMLSRLLGLEELYTRSGDFLKDLNESLECVEQS